MPGITTMPSQSTQRLGSSLASRRNGTIIRAKDVPKVRRACIVGGDSPENPGAEVPTIVLEKDAAGNVVRIRVDCPCGQHAELICAYE
jgi:hypothetical protein